MTSSGVYIVEVPVEGKTVGEMYVFHKERDADKKREELLRQGKKPSKVWEM